MAKKKKSEKVSLERETRVLIEKMSSDLKTVAEGHSVLNRKIDKLDSELNQKIDKIDSEFSEVKSELNSVNMAVMDNGRQIKQNASKIDNLGTKVDRIEKKLDTVIADHEERIKKLELIK